MFYISKTHVDQIIAHSKEELPNECCGILVGTCDQIEKLYRARNVEESPVKYQINSEDLFTAYSEADKNGWEILAFYHSHTHSDAYPSPTDVRLATWPDVLYILISPDLSARTKSVKVPPASIPNL